MKKELTLHELKQILLNSPSIDLFTKMELERTTDITGLINLITMLIVPKQIPLKQL